MPTYERLPKFNADWARLSEEQRERFLRATSAFLVDLREGRGFRKGLRVKRVQGTQDVWELTFSPDGRATWAYGDEVRPGEPHVVWRRIGTHDVLRRP